MAIPEGHQEGQEPLPSQQEVVRRLAGLYADRLFYKILWENTGRGEEERRKMEQTEKGIHTLVTETLPRIQSQEITGISLIESPAPDHFFVSLPGDRIRISMSTVKIEKDFPRVREMIAPWKPPKP